MHINLNFKESLKTLIENDKKPYELAKGVLLEITSKVNREISK